jgi:hypothetical protein
MISDPVAHGARTAALAWTIYTDLRAESAATPTTETVARHIRTTLRETRTLDDGTERIVEVTVEETLRALPEPEPEPPATT